MTWSWVYPENFGDTYKPDTSVLGYWCNGSYRGVNKHQVVITLSVAEETICGFIEQGKFFEACDHIYDLEHSGNDGVGKSESLYTLLAEQMWTVVGEALSGSGGMFLEPLQSVGESLRWEKQKEAEWLGSSQETDSVSTWSPNFWRKDLEEKLIQYMTAQIPPFGSSSNTDETALKQHLNHLETAFLPSLEHRSGVFKEAGLFATYARCCHASLSSHLSALTGSNHFSFRQCLLVYEWGLKMYRRYVWKTSFSLHFPCVSVLQFWAQSLISVNAVVLRTLAEFRLAHCLFYLLCSQDQNLFSLQCCLFLNP